MPGGDPMEAARIIAGELPDLPYLAELPGARARGGPDRARRRAARRHPRRSHRRAAGGSPTAPAATCAAPGPALLRPGRDGGGPGRLPGAAEGPARRAVDARRDDRAAALAEARRSRTPAWSPTSRRRWPKASPRTSPRSPSGCRGRPSSSSWTSLRCPRSPRAGCRRQRPVPGPRRWTRRCCGRGCTRCSPPPGRYTVVHCCSRNLPFGIITERRSGRGLLRPRACCGTPTTTSSPRRLRRALGCWSAPCLPPSIIPGTSAGVTSRPIPLEPSRRCGGGRRCRRATARGRSWSPRRAGSPGRRPRRRARRCGGAGRRRASCRR